MAVTYSQTLKNTRMLAVEAAIEASTDAATLQIANSNGFTNATDILVTISFAANECSVTSDVLTFLSLPVSALASFSGTASQARIRNGAGTTIIDGLTVGTSATNVILNSTSITAGQTVRIDSGTITHG